MMNHALIVLMSIGMLAADPPKTDQADAELARLQGPWMPVGRVFDGWYMSPDGWQYPQLWIVGDRYYIRYYTVRSSIMLADSGRLTIAPTRDPKTIDMISEDPEHMNEVDQGIYLLSGDTLLLCTGTKRPTTFDSPDGSKVGLTLYHRESPDHPRPRPFMGGMNRDDTEPKKFLGTWALTEETVNGRPTPPKKVAGRELRIDKDIYVLRTETPNGHSVQDFGTLGVREEESPRVIYLASDHPEREPLEGIYRLEGDVLTICVAKDRPTEFAAPAGSGATRRVYRRQQDKDDQ